MDDTRTQQALDQLADLFLTGQGPVADAPATEPVEPKRDELVGPAPIRLRPKLTEKPRPLASPSPAGPIEGDAPLRLQPESPAPISEADASPLASIGEAPPSQPAGDTPLHIATDTAIEGEPADPTELAEETPGRAIAIEAVILGNLPGLSGPWLTQYAQLLAQQEGPVAILHIDDELIDLELVEPTHRDAPNRSVSLRMPPGGGKIDPRSILEALMDAPDPQAPRDSSDAPDAPDAPDTAPQTVLVHLDPQNDAQGLARALLIDDWTLMCGADDLAIIAGYKMLKAMVENEPAVARKRIGLMVMGSDPKVSQGAARKFQSASQNFLHTPVQLLGWQKQMVPVNLRHLGRFEEVDAVWPRLAEWFGLYTATEPAAVQDPVISGPTNPVTQGSAVDSVEPDSVPPTYLVPPTSPLPKEELAVAVDDAVAPMRSSRSRSSQLFTDLADLSARPGKLTPPAPPVSTTPSIPPESVEAAVPEQPEPARPASFQPVAEARPTEPVSSEPPVIKAPQPAPSQASPVPPPAPPASPVAPTPSALRASPTSQASDEPNLVELLMAGPGAVPGGVALEARCPHQSQTQLMLDQDGRLHLLCRHESQTDGIDSLQPAMIDLLQASHWVREHRELLALTQRQCKFDSSCEPILHLFTDRADWATALIARLDDALKLHLLQEVRVGEESAWFCTPLN